MDYGSILSPADPMANFYANVKCKLSVFTSSILVGRLDLIIRTQLRVFSSCIRKCEIYIVEGSLHFLVTNKLRRSLHEARYEN